MVLVYLATDECVEVPEARECRRDGEQLLCLDRFGHVVRAFPLNEVSVFTNDPETAELVKEEMCDDEAEEESPTLLV